jgi:hypothetical protein
MEYPQPNEASVSENDKLTLTWLAHARTNTMRDIINKPPFKDAGKKI